MASYEKKTIQRLFGSLSEEDKQTLWLELSEVMESYGEKEQQKIDLAHISEYQEDIEERARNYGKVIGLKSGYSSLDDLTLGLVDGELVVIGGKTSGGKSLLSANLAVNIAKQGHAILFVTLEMTKPEIGSRMLKIAGGDIGALPILFQKQDELGYKDIDMLIENAVANKCKIVFIDHLHYFARSMEHQSEELGKITKELKKNAMRHNVPIVLMSHVRKGNGRGDTELDNDALRGSSYISQDADIVLFVGKHPDPDVNGNPVFGVKITKNRNRGIRDKDGFMFAFNDLRLTEKLI